MLTSIVQGIHAESRKDNDWRSSAVYDSAAIGEKEALFIGLLQTHRPDRAVEIAIGWGRLRAEIEGPQRLVTLMGLTARIDNLLKPYPALRAEMSWLHHEFWRPKSGQPAAGA